MSKKFNAEEAARLEAIRANPGIGAASLTLTAKPRDPQAVPEAPRPLPR